MKKRWIELIATFALVFWAGSTWVTGYVFAPILFATYGSVQAGDIAGHLFHGLNQLGLACSMLILLNYRIQHSKNLLRQRGLWVLLVVLFCVIVIPLINSLF